MKKGQVYSNDKGYGGSINYFLVIEDYGKLRPLCLGDLNHLGTNMSLTVSPSTHNSLSLTFYKDDVLIAETFEEFLLMPIAKEILGVK